MKITKKELREAVNALTENDLLSGGVTASTVSWALWSALRNITREQEPPDHRVKITVEGFLGGLVDGEGESDPDDYRVTVTSKIDEVFDIMNPRITKMEVS